MPASRPSAVRKSSPPPAPAPQKTVRKRPKVELAYAVPAEPISGTLTAPRPGVPRSWNFQPSAYVAARPYCQTRAADAPHTFPPAPADNLVRTTQDLVVRLGQMPIELAAPMLAAPLPALDTTALLALLKATGEAHHAVIAKRKNLDWRVVKAIIRAGHEIAILALAENRDVIFDAEDRAMMNAHAEQMIMVRGALLGRPGFVFATGVRKLNIDDGAGHANLRLVKLARAGRNAVFVRDAARRLHLAAPGLASALGATPDVTLALLSCALGMDRAVFAHLLALWHAQHGQPHREDAPHRPLLMSIFALSAEDALRKLSASLPAAA